MSQELKFSLEVASSRVSSGMEKQVLKSLRREVQVDCDDDFRRSWHESHCEPVLHRRREVGMVSGGEVVETPTAVVPNEVAQMAL